MNAWSIFDAAQMENHLAAAFVRGLPGGLIETDETVAQTALREFEEELGSASAELKVIGQLTPVYVFVSGFEVTPLVAVSSGGLVFHPNPHEVAAVVELPVAELSDPARRGQHVIERRGLRFTVPHFAIAGQHVWGATSLILAEFVAVLNSQQPEPNLVPVRSR